MKYNKDTKDWQTHIMANNIKTWVVGSLNAEPSFDPLGQVQCQQVFRDDQQSEWRAEDVAASKN